MVAHCEWLVFIWTNVNLGLVNLFLHDEGWQMLAGMAHLHCCYMAIRPIESMADTHTVVCAHAEWQQGRQMLPHYSVSDIHHCDHSSSRLCSTSLLHNPRLNTGTTRNTVQIPIQHMSHTTVQP